MKATKRTTRKAVQRVRTTVGELIASLVDVVGVDRARVLLADRSLLQRVLRQKLVLA
jgi:hypothetical protein